MINVPNINPSAINKTGTITNQTQAVPANVSQQNNTNPNYTTTIYPQETVSVYNPAENAPKLTHTSWFYINDVHGKMTNMERIYNISKEFDSTPSNVMASKFFTESDNVSKFKVSSGDVILGEEIIPNTVASQFLNWSGFMASALGNHELDITKPETFAKLLSESSYKMLAANVDVDPNSPLADKIHKGDVFIIYCRPPREVVLNLKTHQVKDYDTPSHLKALTKKSGEILDCYDENLRPFAYLYDYTE